MENQLETSLDILAHAIDKRSERYLLLATDPESENSTLLACSVSSDDLIILLMDFFRADERFANAAETALKSVYALQNKV